MTPLQLTIMLCSYIGSEEAGHYNKTTEVYKQQLKSLLDAEMIYPFQRSNKEDYCYKVTLKGTVWMNYILGTPFPISQYVIPDRE